MEATLSSETSVRTRSTRRHIPDNGILHSHRLENLKLYVCLTHLFSRSMISIHSSWGRKELRTVPTQMAGLRLWKSMMSFGKTRQDYVSARNSIPDDEGEAEKLHDVETGWWIIHSRILACELCLFSLPAYWTWLELGIIGQGLQGRMGGPVGGWCNVCMGGRMRRLKGTPTHSSVVCMGAKRGPNIHSSEM
jgi:hypothetical protein